MNIFKKSQANVWLLCSVAIFITIIAVIRHPSIRPMLSYTSQQTWQDLIKTLENQSSTEAQDLWEFREFYSRGTVTLARYQTLQTPTEFPDVLKLPTSFMHHTAFSSSKIQSIEGSIESSEDVFFSKEDLRELPWQILLQTESVQIIGNTTETQALIIGVFDMETASTANGYLYFDWLNDDFKTQHENKKWLVVSLVTI